MNSKDASRRHARAPLITAFFRLAAFTLGFASCCAVTLHTPWGDSVWPGPLIGGLVTQAVLSVAFRRRLLSPTWEQSWRYRGEWLLRFILMTILIAAANFAVGALALGMGFHD